MKSPFKWCSSLSRYRLDHHLLGNRIEGICCFWSKVHDSRSVLFCLDWKGCVIRRFCFSGRYFLLGSFKYLLQSFLPSFYSCCWWKVETFSTVTAKYLENRISTVWISISWCFSTFWGYKVTFGKGVWRSASFGSLRITCPVWAH